MTTLVLPTASVLRLDWPRVTALSGTLSLHLLIFLLIFVPPTAITLMRLPTAEPMIVHAIVLPTVQPAIPVVPQPMHHVHATAPKPHSAQSDPMQIVVDPPNPVALPADPFVLTSAKPSTELTQTAPTALAYGARTGVRYPVEALRRHEQGTVVLRVLVGVDGKPDEVEVETSSGSSRLDAAAREAVKQWTFRAGTRSGMAFAAWARVPITFDLRNL